MTIFQLPTVQRIHTARGSHIEPPLRTNASNHEKLLWHAAVTAHDTGLNIQIAPASHKIKRFGRWVEPEPYWSIIVGNTSTALPYHAAWHYLNGIETGAKTARNERKTK